MNEKDQTLKLLKQNEYADVYTIDGETDKPQGLVVTPDNKLRYFGDKAGYDKEYIIVLPNTPKTPVDLFKIQENKDFFCQEHNVSWLQLPRDENNAAAEGIMDFFEKHRNLLDILKKR